MSSRTNWLAALAIIAMFAFAHTTSAEAGTLVKSKSCSITGVDILGDRCNTNIYLGTPTFNCNNPFETHPQHYVRFGSPTTLSWYPSHRAVITNACGGNPYMNGSWTSARFAYSPVIRTIYPQAYGHQNTTTSPSYNYDIQIYAGTY